MTGYEIVSMETNFIRFEHAVAVAFDLDFQSTLGFKLHYSLTDF